MTPEKEDLHIEGMTCSNCALGVTRYLEKQGLSNVSVDYSTGEVRYDSGVTIDTNQLAEGIKKLGYHLVTESDHSALGHSHGDSRFPTLEHKLLISALLTLPLLGHMFFHAAWLHNPWFQFCLALPVFIIGMMHFGRSGLASLKTGVPNMDVLITVGTAAAFLYSCMGWITHYGSSIVSNYMFFETSSTIITLVLLGNYIEKRSVKQTTNSIRTLAAMQPSQAVIIRIGADQKEIQEQIPVKEIKKGDALLVRTGEQIPADGKVYWGNASVDESMMTGENLPVAIQNNSHVFAGTIIQDGAIKMVAEKTGKQTALSNIIELVKSASSNKPPIQKLGDKISAWFVPVVISVSIIAFAINYFIADVNLIGSLMRSIAVLVISCPCAMGLAAPTAVAVGLGKAARQGILIKGGDTLEMFSGIKTAVFDKTGTLTTGKFEVGNIELFGSELQQVINLLVSLEQHSSHPIAKSVVEHFAGKATRFISFSNVDEVKGLGLKAVDEDGVEFKIGSYVFHNNPGFPANSQVYLTRNNELIATLEIRDSVREGAKKLIDKLHSMGIDTILLSGDTAKNCSIVQQATGINKVYASKLPHQKAELIQSFKKEGRLLMVGDGVNDAPSLAGADIGISFSNASKVAINSASVILLNTQDLTEVIRALKIGKYTLQTIRQNFFWAFFYNIIAIPVAAAGFLSPMVAALSMAFSDVIVIGNSIRLNYRNFNVD